MKLLVNPHTIEIVKEPVNEKEINISKCEFEFTEEITEDYVKEAYFTFNGQSYKQIIVNDKCDIPSEVLEEKGQVEIGVVAYLLNNDEYVKRYNPSPVHITTWVGSLKDNAENSEPITPSEMEQYEQALQDGLTEVNEKLDDIDQALEDVNTAITETNNLDLDVSKEGKVATVTLTKKDASTKVVTLSDGTNLMFNWQGTSLGIKTDEDADYTYVDLQGVQGETGPMGAPFTIKKTYSSVAEMNADFNNMEVGDYVMITSSIEMQDNAKLYCKGEEAWIFITDFSGATGIQGPTGATPNISIGTVTSGDTPSVTRTGTNENPVLNFVLEKGDKGDTGNTGPTGNGIASITKTSTSGLVDTYTITYTNGDTTTFTVTNGEVSQAQLDETNLEVEKALMVYNALPKVSGSGTDITLNNTAETPLKLALKGDTYQYTTTGANLQKYNARTSGIYICDSNGQITLSGTQQNAATLAINQSGNEMSLEAGTYIVKFVGNLDGIVTASININGSTNNKTINSDQEVSFTLTETSNVRTLIAVASGQTYNANFYVTCAKDTATTERYTGGIASPNPNYPQEVQVVTGNNNINICSENLFDKENSTLISKTIGTNTRWGYKLPKMANNFYASRQASDSAGFRIFEDINGTMTPAMVSSLPVQPALITNTSNDFYLLCTSTSIKTTAEDNFNNNNFMISYKNITYKPYQGQNYPINLGKNLINLINSEAGGIDSSGTETSTTGNWRGTEYILVSPNTKYTMSLNTSSLFRIYEYDKNKNFISPRTETTGKSKTITTTSNTKYLRWTVFKTGEIDLSYVQGLELQLEKGDKATTYAPYFTPIEFAKITNADYIKGTPNNWKKYKVIGKYIFDGTENWVSQPSYGTNSWSLNNIISVNYDTTKVQILSTKFRGISQDDRNTGGNNTIYTVSNTSFYIRNTTLTTKAEVQSATSGTPIYYPLATPVEETITNSTLVSQLNEIYYKAKSYKDQTNISVTGDLPLQLDIETVRDLSGIFDE